MKYFLLLSALALFFENAGTARAQGTAFTYQGSLTDQGSPATGIYDLRFTVFDALADGNAVGIAVEVNDLNVSNGLFTATIDPGANVFTGPPRWLNIGVRPGTSAGAYTDVAPRQALTASPYAIKALSATTATTAGMANSVAAGSVGSVQLASGAAAANLAASGQAGVASGGMVLSLTENNIPLVNAGYVKLAGSLTVNDTWLRLNAGGAPAARGDHSAVWTGSEMIVWGGKGNSGSLNDGGRYNPAANTWTAMSTIGAPVARDRCTAIWTGSELIVWGGYNDSGYLNDGGRYKPATNSWTAVAATGAPAGRYLHTAVWSGSEMIVWGGSNGSNLNSGGRYNPAANSWGTAMTINGIPAGRYQHSAVWSGTAMIVWGGFASSVTGSQYFNDGGLYRPSANSWTAVTGPGAPGARESHTAIWTGSEMIVWGGYNVNSASRYLNDGGRYNPVGNNWTVVTPAGAPSGRNNHTVVWTGSEMIVWGGFNLGGYLNSGGRYNPAVDMWSPVPASGAEARGSITAVWTGAEMIVCGGSRSPDVTYYYNDTWSFTLGKLMFLYMKP